MRQSFILKILPAIFLFALAFNFIHSEILEQFEGKSECQQTYDYCKLIQEASVKTAVSDKIGTHVFAQIDFICPSLLKFELRKELYEKHQNFCFYHLVLPSTYLLNRTLLI
ncbi:hypothetical protein [Ignavibacterium album]|uniref:hypothetical protein n=1 Tax=Ignavibacterium album TaxID=591197 RepID=UPI0035BAB707